MTLCVEKSWVNFFSSLLIKTTRINLYANLFRFYLSLLRILIALCLCFTLKTSSERRSLVTRLVSLRAAKGGKQTLSVILLKI